MKSLLCVMVTITGALIILQSLIPNTAGQSGYADKTSNNFVGHQVLVAGNSKLDINKSISKINLYSNDSPVFFDNQQGIISLDLHSFWKDRHSECITDFRCIVNFSGEWKNTRSSLKSTLNDISSAASSIYGSEINVTPGKKYGLVSLMKLNKGPTQSPVVLEGFNATSRHWYKIKECPSDFNSLNERQENNCLVIIPKNMTKVRPVLNARWSSQQKEDAKTWLDSLYMSKVGAPFIFDVNLKPQVVYRGLNRPTSMAFLGPNDILVLEKNTGKVMEIKNGISRTILDLNVANLAERGLLGIAISPKYKANEGVSNKQNGENQNNVQESLKKDKYVFLYFTEARTSDGDDKNGSKPIGNRLYRYEFINDTHLGNPKLLLDLPAGLHHNGGNILIGPDKDLYIGVGDLDNVTRQSDKRNQALNYEKKDEPDGRGGILRIDADGSPKDTDGILGSKGPLNKYYAYGIRNSFGMDFDPLTHKLWDTENGPNYGDEINLIEPGFNSGWKKVQGIWNVAKHMKQGEWLSKSPSNLVDFDGKGKYSSPEFTWNNTVGPTALKFLTTDKLGIKYKNDIFVGDFNNGYLYHFGLTKKRTQLSLNGLLNDKIANNTDELKTVTFGGGFGAISDIEVGPDGYLYALDWTGGRIYRIMPHHPNAIASTGHMDEINSP